MEPKQFVDIICPAHDRTSCSDRDKSNGFGAREESFVTEKVIDGETWSKTETVRTFRCKRCALLDMMDGDIPDRPQYFMSYPEIGAMIRFLEYKKTE